MSDDIITRCARTPLACPLCAMPTGPGERGRLFALVDDSPKYGPGSTSDMRKCEHCGLRVRLPRTPFARAITRTGRG